MTGVGYAAVTSTAEASVAMSSQTQIDQGKQLFQQGCATCHGLAAQGSSEGPSLIGVGAAAVNFQVATGRMPMAQPANQAPRKVPVYNDDQIAALAAYVASLGPGPAVPSDEDLNTTDANLAEGGVLFRTNCAQCHNFAGHGGALSNGKYAPSMMNATPRQMYEAMLTGPQNMPVFNDMNLTPSDKKDIVAYLEYLKENPSPGGLELGSLGPVSEGLFIWIFGLGAIIGLTIWITAKSN